MADVRTSAFMLSSATLMLGRAFVDDVFSLTPSQHSIGMVSEVTVPVESSMNELSNGVSQTTVDGKRTGISASITANVFEMTAQNFMRSQAMSGASVGPKRGRLTASAPGGATSLQIASDPLPGELASAITTIPAGSTLLIQRVDGEQDFVFPTKTTGNSTTSNGVLTVPIAGNYSVPPAMFFAIGARVWVVDSVGVGDIDADDLFCVKITGTLSNFDRPVIYVAPKVRMVKGFGLSFNETQYSSMAWEMKPLIMSAGEVSSMPRLAEIGSRRSGTLFVGAGGNSPDYVPPVVTPPVVTPPVVTPPSGSVSISNSVSKNEGNGGVTAYTYTVSRSVSSGAVSIPWIFTPGTTDSSDYVGNTMPTGGTLNLADGVLTATITINVQGDTGIENDESFSVSITPPSGYTAGASMTATGTLVNEDVNVLVTPYGGNSPFLGNEFGNTELWNRRTFTVPTQVNVTLTRLAANTYDGSYLTMDLNAGATNEIMGYPQWSYGNAYVYNGVPLVPKKISELSTFWNYIDWSYTGSDQINLLFEAMLTAAPVTSGSQSGNPKLLEAAIFLHVPEKTKQFIFANPCQKLGGYVDAWGRAWTAVFKANSGSSQLGYLIFFPSDMEDRFTTEFDYAAMLKFALPKIANTSLDWYVNGVMLGVEPYGLSGRSVVTRDKWVREFNNIPYANPAKVYENLVPNSKLLSQYGWSSTQGVSFPGDGSVTINGSSQFNRSWIPVPLEPGRSYLVSYDITDYVGGSVRVDLTTDGSAATVGSVRNANGSYTETLVATSTANAIGITTMGASTTTLKLRNIRVVPQDVVSVPGSMNFALPAQSGLLTLIAEDF